MNRRVYIGRDNLEVMRQMDAGSVDLIYLDPPFNTGKIYNSATNNASFSDVWGKQGQGNEYIAQCAGDSMAAYCDFMSLRLLEMHRLLKHTGSIYLHCDVNASHYIKTLMDNIFGHQNFRNEIVWQRHTARSDGNRFGRIHDIILYYAAKGACWRNTYVPFNVSYIQQHYKCKDDIGRYRLCHLTGPSIGNKNPTEISWKGFKPINNRTWAVPLTGNYAAWLEENIIPDYRKEKGITRRLDLLSEHNLIVWSKSRIPNLKYYLKGSRGIKVNSIWTDIPPLGSNDKQRVEYPTQKPLALLKRIIHSSSNECDIVLDPFCGSGTTCVAAEHLNRQWIGIEKSKNAKEILVSRLQQAIERHSDFFLDKKKITMIA